MMGWKNSIESALKLRLGVQLTKTDREYVKAHVGTEKANTFSTILSLWGSWDPTR